MFSFWNGKNSIYGFIPERNQSGLTASIRARCWMNYARLSV